MRERKLKIIITLMAIAVISLIYVQYYWISVAFKIEEEKFDRNVNEAMHQVVKKLEKHETAAVLFKSIGVDDDIFITSNDTQVKKIDLKTAKPARDRNRNGIDIEVKVTGISKSDSMKPGYYFEEHRVSQKIGTNHKEHVSYHWKPDSVLMRKKIILNDVIKEILVLSDTLSIKDRIHKEKIDSLVSRELLEKGVKAKYVLALDTHEADTLIYIGDNSKDKRILYSGFKTRLFPQDVVQKGDFIRLYFPEKETYILGNMFLMLLFSGLIIIVIIAVFYNTVKMFVNQKKLSELKNDLINNITHEFKTPISTIALACEALNEPQLIEGQDSYQKYTGMIKEENKRLSTLVENLLNTALLEKGKYDFSIEEVDIHEIIRCVIEKHKVGLTSGVINYNLEAEKYLIVGDEFHLTNIVNNLVDNAVKYSGDKINVTAATENYEQGIVITIKDKGQGISKHNISKIFDTFYRIPTGNLHNVKGYGIGLSYVKAMVDAHKGRIEVQSSLNEGSIFKVYLPYGKD